MVPLGETTLWGGLENVKIGRDEYGEMEVFLVEGDVRDLGRDKESLPEDREICGDNDGGLCGVKGNLLGDKEFCGEIECFLGEKEFCVGTYRG